MEQIVIKGGKKLYGEIQLKSAKNSVLPIIAACLLTEEEVVIKNCAPISDIMSMLRIIRSLGGKAEFSKSDIYVCCKDVDSKSVEAELTRGIRSSIFILGPILGRFKRAEISYPGGCEIGLRPIDLHTQGLRKLNASVTETGGKIICDGRELKGGVVSLDFPSVGATENVMMAAVLAAGRTVIINAAKEPEIADLAAFLNAVGAKIYGAGSSTVTIEGVKRLKGGEFTPIADRITAGTFMTAAAMCGGRVTLKGIENDYIASLSQKLALAGAEITEGERSVTVEASGRMRALHKTETQPYPGFPTDMQAQLTAMLSTADGISMVVENLFESRFKYTVQLNSMGAKILVKDRVAVIKGVKKLCGGFVAAEDLRGGAALIMAGLAAEGVTTVDNIYHVDRGYYRIENDLAILGADIKRTAFSQSQTV